MGLLIKKGFSAIAGRGIVKLQILNFHAVAKIAGAFPRVPLKRVDKYFLAAQPNHIGDFRQRIAGILQQLLYSGDADVENSLFG